MGSLSEAPQRLWGLTVIQAALSSKQRGDEAIPNSQSQVVGRLASRILLLDACIASVKGMRVNRRTQALGPQGLALPKHGGESGSLLTPPSPFHTCPQEAL